MLRHEAACWREPTARLTLTSRALMVNYGRWRMVPITFAISVSFPLTLSAFSVPITVSRVDMVG